jgi:uncharacterized membrane protein
MTSTAGPGSTDPRVSAYLDELQRALAGAPESVRSEVYDEVRQHILDELAGRPNDVTAVPDVLDRLGDPADIAREAGAYPPASTSAIEHRPSRGHEIAALLLLEGGGFLGFFALLGHGHVSGGEQLLIGLLIGAVAWVVGVVLLWTSRYFTANDKLFGTLLIPGGFTGTLVALAVTGLSAAGGAQTCISQGVATSTGVDGTVHTTGPTVSTVTCSGGGTDWVLLAIAIVVLVIAVAGPIYTTARLGGRISDI